jgi:amino-acid N-acetyltransferase
MPNSAPTNQITFRPARLDDVPRMAELMTAAHLPPMFIEEHLDGFMAGARDGNVIACGGVEYYGDCAVIRSVVVDEAGRGLGLGGKLADILMDNARNAGAADLYLFTADALPFWIHYGFVEVTFDDWKDAPRACWQYQFLSQNRDMVPEVHPMWRKA